MAKAKIIKLFRLEEIYEWSKYVDNPFDVQNLHHLRIATKRLRYTLELFQEVLNQKVDFIIEELKKIQDELGEIHDHDVLIALLRLCLGSQDGGKSYELALVKVVDSKKKTYHLPPTLVAELVKPSVIPNAKERFGLEQLLLRNEKSREEAYQKFRQHWYQLQANDIQKQIHSVLKIG
jgi:CHAD domain-containing protein